MGIEYCNYNSGIILLPSLDIIDHKIWFIDRARSIVGSDFFSNNVVNIVLAYLLLNTKQEIIVCEIMHHNIYNPMAASPKYSDQLLFVIRGKDGIGKSQVIKEIN